MNNPQIRLALFASGSGSNVQALLDYFGSESRVRPVVLVTDNPKAYAVIRATEAGLPAVVLPRSGWNRGELLLRILRGWQVDGLALAGYLKKIPAAVVEAYPNRILNIHPSLLPKFGGQGMYGLHVHEAVLAAGDPETGITIHIVTENYDEGPPLFQARLPVEPGWSAQELQQAVLRLEHTHYAPTISDYFSQLTT
jgi:phosphoribosylglycinamide formyltransferase-1